MKKSEETRLSRRQFLLASTLAGGGLILPCRQNLHMDFGFMRLFEYV